MNNQWLLETHGDPLGTVREFIKHIWLGADLDGMLVTMTDGFDVHATPRYINNVTLINEINPFKPLMEINAARLVPHILANHPGGKVGALLRPCEMRALNEMAKHAGFNVDRLLTISVDCLGTLPADEYQWRLERMEKNLPPEEASSAEPTDELAQEALKFARQGGIVPYRYRSACQVCTSPAATQAHINLHILGLPVRQHMLVTLGNPYQETPLNIKVLADGKPDQDLVIQHERMLAKMGERHQRTMERLNDLLTGLLPADVDAVIRLLESCGDCEKCMEACPICSVDKLKRSSDGHYNRQGVMRWLVSCAGCGMCEQSCPNHLPIAALFAHVRKQLDEEWQYVPGRSVDEPLPHNINPL